MITQSDITLSTPETAQVLDFMNRYGVVVIPNYLQGKTLEKLNQEYDDIIQTTDVDFQKHTPYSNGTCVRMNRKAMDNHFPTTAAVFSSEFMLKLTKAYLGADGELNSEIFIVNDVVGTRHVANDMHFDIIPTFKFFIYLSDTTAENGAFTCVPTSHLRTDKIRQALGRKISFENREISRDLPYEENEPISLEGKAGTLIIFTTETFHRAGIVAKGERRVMRGHCRTQELNGDKNLIQKFFKRIRSIAKN